MSSGVRLWDATSLLAQARASLRSRPPPGGDRARGTQYTVVGDSLLGDAPFEQGAKACGWTTPPRIVLTSYEDDAPRNIHSRRKWG